MPRDMTPREFSAALKRNGFRKVMFWIDRPNRADNTISVGVIMGMDGKLRRRATIAHAIRQFAAHDAAEAKARHQPTPPLLAAMESK